MPQLDRGLVKARAARLRAVAERLHGRHLEKLSGSRQVILVERNGMAHTEDFTLAAAPGLSPGALVGVTITGHNGRHLQIGTAAHAAA